MPQIEAAACGVPVISCNNTGMSEYLREENSYMITNDKTEICRPEMHWISPWYHGQQFPKIGQEQIEQAISHMHEVVNDYNKACSKGELLKRDVFDRLTWSKCANRVAKRLGEIGEG